MRFLKTYEEVTFSDIFPKNQWVKLSKDELDKIKDELWVIIDNSYGPLGGHVRIKDKDSILTSDLDFWRAVDIDADPYADVVIFGRHTKHGFKISGWGHDGEKKSKKELMSQLKRLLRTRGLWIEVSSRPSEILLKNGVKYVNSFDKVSKLFPESKIKWIGNHPIDDELKKFNGFYTRTLAHGDETDIEIILGNPIL